MSRDMISLDFVSGVLQAVKDKLRTFQPDYRQKLRIALNKGLFTLHRRNRGFVYAVLIPI